MFVKKLALAAVAAVTALSFSTPADAALVRACVATGPVTFSAPLDLTIKTGTLSFDYGGSCLDVSTTGSSGIQPINNGQSFTYDGSCLTATLTGPNGITGVLVGGVGAVTIQLNGGSPLAGARAWVLIPDSLNPCAFSTGTAINAGPDVWTP